MTSKSSKPEEIDRAEFLQAYGSAVLRWQNVESELAGVFCALFRPPSESGRRAAEAAIHALMANAKLGAVDAAVQMYFYGDAAMLKRWKELHDLVKANIDQRNSLAHGTWLVHIELDAADTYSATHTVGKHPGKAKKGGRSFTTFTLVEAAAEFSSIAVALKHFNDRLWNRPVEIA